MIAHYVITMNGKRQWEIEENVKIEHFYYTYKQVILSALVKEK